MYRNIIRTYIMDGQVEQYHAKLESTKKLFPCVDILLKSYAEQRNNHNSHTQASNPLHRQVTPDLRRSSRRLTPSPSMI